MARPQTGDCAQRIGLIRFIRKNLIIMSKSDAEILAVDRDGPAKTISLNRPEKLNALSTELAERLMDEVINSSADGTRLLIFTGTGNGFSGGFDFGGIGSQSDGDLAHRLIRIEMLLQAVYHAPMTTLALAHGPCFGAAADLVCACHERVGAPDVRFRMPGLGFGVVLGTRRLSLTIGADAAREILGTSKIIDAAEARRVGLITKVCDRTEWPELIANAKQAVQTLDTHAQRALHDRTTVDTRDSDMAALARSVSQPGLKSRIQAYLEMMTQHSQSDRRNAGQVK